MNWKTIIENFYPDIEEAVEKAQKELAEVKIEDEVTDVVCEQCGRNMVIKYGPHGRFLACPGFPECRNTKPYLEKVGVACPICGKDVVLRKTKKGRKYYGCEDNPECEFMSWQKPSDQKCPRCGSYMVEKGNKLCCSNEQCGFVAVCLLYTSWTKKVRSRRARRIQNRCFMWISDMRQSNTIFSDEEKNKESLSRILREIKKLEIADFLLFSRRSAILFLQNL